MRPFLSAAVLDRGRFDRTPFRLVPTSMTLNDLERRNGLYFAFFPAGFDRFSGGLYHSG